MPNNTTGIFEQLVVPAATASAQVAKFSNAMLNYCFTDYSGQRGAIGQTMLINVPIVNENDVNNIGAGNIQLTDTNHTPTSITIDQNASVAKRIQNFDQIRTSLDLQRLYFDGMIESLLRKVNRSIAALANPGAGTGFLSVNAAAASAATDSWDRDSVAEVWYKLAAQGCPMDPANCFFVSHSKAYGITMGDPTLLWIQQYVVGTPAAEKLQQTARWMPQFNMTFDYDQTFPMTAGGKQIGLGFHRYAIGLKPVVPITPDTGGYVKELIIYPRPDLPVHVQFWYDPSAQGYVLHAHTVYGLKVIRPEWGCQAVAA